MNAGYDRWWEARKLWGGIVNDSRALATNAVVYGPNDDGWRDRVLRWTIAYAHSVRRSLRGERTLPEIANLLGQEAADEIAQARHMPTAVSRQIATVLREGFEKVGESWNSFLAAEQGRARLLDHLGGCERIMKTPLPRVVSINIRRFILLFLATLPFALLSRVDWLTPHIMLLMAYPILAIDRIGVALQNPFDARELGSLPLDDICNTIEADLLALSPFTHTGPHAPLTSAGGNPSQFSAEPLK